MADLWLISRERVERLTNAETVLLGRALNGASANSHVWYPDDAAKATAVVTNYAGDLSSKARDRATEILGDFDSDLRDPRVRAHLDLEDWQHVGWLKHLRARSMSNPRWRDADALARFLRRWDVESPLDSARGAAERAVTEYRKAGRRKDEAAMDRCWLVVQSSVDHLIERADRLAGRRISDR